MSVGAPTAHSCAPTYRPGETAVSGDGWIPVRRDGKLLFEYDPKSGMIRLRRWGRVFVVDLAPLQGQMLAHDAR